MKRLASLGLVLALAGFARADYLYWQVTPTTISGDEYLKTLSSAPTFAALFYGSDEVGWTKAPDAADVLGNGNGYLDIMNSGSNYAAFDLSQFTSAPQAFYIELYNYDNANYTAVARSATASYSDLGQYVGTGGSMSEVPRVNISIWQGGGYHAIPEPTSALLMMIGAALVALKRKRA